MATYQRSKLLTVSPYILGNEFGERLAYYGLATNLVNYFKDLGASSATSAIVVSLFSGFCYLSPLLGGWLADSYLGRFKTILIFSLVYVVGMFSLTGSASIPGIKVEDGDNANGGQWTLLGFCLFLVSLGSGGLKANVSSFGADQFDETKERDREEKKRFFNWFYFFINVGALIASTLIVYIQDHDMWDIGFGIPGVVLFLAVLLFIFGKPLYTMVPVTESPLERFFKVTRTALRKRKAHLQLKSANNDASTDAPLIPSTSSDKKEHWLDWAVGPDDFTQKQVAEIKLVYGVFPIFFTSIFFWVVYLQMSGLFVLQGNQMERKVDFFGIHDKIPAASLTVFNTASIIILIPIYEFLVIPGLKKYLKYTPTLLQRIGAGYVVAVLAMLSAYIIEVERLKRADDGNMYTIIEDDDEVWVVRLSIWWQGFSSALIGTSEVLASIGLLEFFYDQAPDSMRSMMAALNLIGTALGGYVSSLLMLIVNEVSKASDSKWVTDNLNEGHLDYFFLLIAGIMLLSTIVFIFLAMNYEYKTIRHADADGEVVQPQLLENLGRSVAYTSVDPNTTGLL